MNFDIPVMKRMKPYCFFLFVIAGFKGFSQNDSLVSFWKTVKPLSYISGYMPADVNLCNVPGGFFLLKNDFDGWLLIGNGSGVVCRLTDNFQWERLDNTVFSGYNFGAFPLGVRQIALSRISNQV